MTPDIETYLERPRGRCRGRMKVSGSKEYVYLDHYDMMLAREEWERLELEDLPRVLAERSNMYLLHIAAKIYLEQL